jgi:formate hydrogenlyase subunit 3/multisubunit Na+/H+ antiporter MnhD subunit
MGLALLAVAGAVVVRFGAIPAHAWMARFAEALPASAVPPLLGWGAAAFAIVALGWVDVTLTSAGAQLSTERALIMAVGAASIVLGGIAAVLHDDLEHVLAYAIVQDAGVALLAFATLGGTAAAAGRDWIVAAVAVKAGLAAWVLVTRATFRVHRRQDLGGWARRAPLLGLGLALVLLGSVGLPGMAAFEARSTLLRLALPGPVGVLMLLAAFAPLAYLGRLLLTGVDAMSPPVRDAAHATARVRGGRADGWANESSIVRAVPLMIRANRFPLAAAAAALVAFVGVSVAIGGLGSTAVGEVPGGEQAAPSASAGVVGN